MDRPGLKPTGGEEVVGDDGEDKDATLEDGYEAELRVELRDPHFSIARTFLELDAGPLGLPFWPGEPLGEKNSSSEEPPAPPPPSAFRHWRGRGGRGRSSGEPSFRYGEPQAAAGAEGSSARPRELTRVPR